MLSASQLATLKTDILADATFNGVANNSDGNQQIADAYNLSAAPDYWVWKTRVTKSELVTSVSSDGTTFSWTGAGFITRSQGERDAWRELFDDQGTCNPSLVNVRTAFTDIFSGGTAPAPANRTHLATVARRKATRAEKLFATGAGTTASPSLLVFEGNVTFEDVDKARNS